MLRLKAPININYHGNTWNEKFKHGTFSALYSGPFDLTKSTRLSTSTIFFNGIQPHRFLQMRHFEKIQNFNSTDKHLGNVVNDFAID